MKKVISLLMSFVMLLSVTSGLSLNAYAGTKTSGKCGKSVFWNYNTTTATLIISGNGKMYDYGYENRVTPKWSVFGSFESSSRKKAPSIKKVIFEEGVTSIGESAFDECEDIEYIYLSSTIERIDSNLNEGFALKNIEVSSQNNYFSTNNGILFSKDESVIYCYPSQKKSNTYNIPNTVETIKFGAFAHSELENVQIPDSVKRIEHGAFYFSARLNKIFIPSSVEYIGENVFSTCYNLKEINVDNNNGYYSSENGILFNKTKTELIKFPPNKNLSTYNIPNSVVLIYPHSFTDATKLYSVSFPSSIKSIGYSTFFDSGIKTVFIPKNVSEIDDAFFCSDLYDVYYSGNKDDWQAMKIDDEHLKSATIHFEVSSLPKSKPKPTSTKITSIKNTKEYTAFNWQKAKNVAGYHIQMSTDKNFKKNVKKCYVQNNKYNKYKTYNLKNNKIYYLRVRGYGYLYNGKKVYGKWSKVKSVKTK